MEISKLLNFNDILFGLNFAANCIYIYGCSRTRVNICSEFSGPVVEVHEEASDSEDEDDSNKKVSKIMFSTFSVLFLSLINWKQIDCSASMLNP